MPIPTWARILDTELDAESSVTESLMTRLYKNVFAVLGLDPDSVSAPVFQLVPSMIKRGSVDDFIADPVAAATYHYTNDVAVSVTDSQALELSRCFGGSGAIGQHLVVTSGDNATMVAELSGIEVDWSAGVPATVVLVYHSRNGVVVPGTLFHIGPLATRGGGVIGIPINNSYYDIYGLYQTIGTVLKAVISAKAQVIGNLVYVRFRFIYATDSACYISFTHHRSIYTPKG